MHLLPVFARLSSAMWLEDEELRTKFATIELCENESLCAQSNEAEWTNNPFLARLSWILDYVVPIAEADYATLGSSANLETPLREIPFLWSDQNFRVVQHVVCLPMMMSTSPWRSRVGLADSYTLE